MGTVIDFQAHRDQRRQASAVARLDQMIARLDRLVMADPGRVTGKMEMELCRIVTKAGEGNHEDAARRAERLVNLLEHPAASG